MSFERPLRGSCACRRNQYMIRAPQGVDEVAQVLFSSDSLHRSAQASPLSAHLRVPLTWYHSATFALFPDETASAIRRVYDNPLDGHSRRNFCGFCGTPLTYWSEQPRGESNYIQITLGSLCRDDLGDLEELGLIPESLLERETFEFVSRSARESVQDRAVSGAHVDSTKSTALQTTDRGSTGIPWFDTLIQGSSLGGRLKSKKGTRQSPDGTTKVEWEIVEYTAGDEDSNSHTGNNGKRKLGDRDDADDARMEGVSHQ